MIISMFTGIIKELGTVAEMTHTNSATIITCQSKIILHGIQTGESIAVNGVCLTVTSFAPGLFKADISPETLEKSNLRFLKAGDMCNLEPALCAGEPLGGHFGTGHIDGTGKILTVTKKGNSHLIKISAPGKLMKYIAPKGSVAIQGVSLTPFNCNENSFDVAIIPHTMKETTLQNSTPGMIVNIECDIISKYIEQLIEYRGLSTVDKNKKQKIDTQYLRDKGFLI
jgi:riboflavin synthase